MTKSLFCPYLFVFFPPASCADLYICSLLSRFSTRVRAYSAYVIATPYAHRRFLRARRFDPKKAMKQFADSEAWRAKHNVEALYASFPVDEFERARRFYPRWTGRRDKV